MHVNSSFQPFLFSDCLALIPVAALFQEPWNTLPHSTPRQRRYRLFLRNASRPISSIVISSNPLCRARSEFVISDTTIVPFTYLRTYLLTNATDWVA